MWVLCGYLSWLVSDIFAVIVSYCDWIVHSVTELMRNDTSVNMGFWRFYDLAIIEILILHQRELHFIFNYFTKALPFRNAKILEFETCNFYLSSEKLKINKAPGGIEPPTPGLQDQCSSHWAMEPVINLPNVFIIFKIISDHQYSNNSWRFRWNARDLQLL